jgi:1-acyl-sn-glycerol-3-phosphate acyltransferase
MIKRLVITVAKLVSGSNIRWQGCEPNVRQRVYFANHTSNLDALVIWAALPAAVRDLTRPVAARDYWVNNWVRRYLANQVFNALLIERKKPTKSNNPLTDMLKALDEKHSLIIFPKGDGRPMGK